MIKKTKYKIVLHKGVRYIFYQKNYKFWFVKWFKWLPIPYPNEKGKVKYVCDRIREYKNLNHFMIHFIDVELYFKTLYVERKKKFK